MNEFRIIAIKTGEKQTTYPKDRTGVRLDFLKVLKPNTIYSFYDYYKFPKNDFTEIRYYQKEYLGLYELSSHPKNSRRCTLFLSINTNSSSASSTVGRQSVISESTLIKKSVVILIAIRNSYYFFFSCYS